MPAIGLTLFAFGAALLTVGYPTFHGDGDRIGYALLSLGGGFTAAGPAVYLFTRLTAASVSLDVAFAMTAGAWIIAFNILTLPVVSRAVDRAVPRP